MHNRLRRAAVATTIRPGDTACGCRPKLRHVRRWFILVLLAVTLFLSWLATTATLPIAVSQKEQQLDPVSSKTTVGGMNTSSSSSSSSSTDFRLRPMKNHIMDEERQPRLPPVMYSKPRLFLHVGPHKSATTTLQCALHQSSHLLARDSMVFLGKVDFSYCGGSITVSSSNEKRPKKPKLSEEQQLFKRLDKCLLDVQEDCWHRVTNVLDSYRNISNKNHNITRAVIFSKEGLSSLASTNHSTADERDRFWNRLEQTLEHWNVTIVITYRRYMEWLPSAKIQDDYHRKIQFNPPWPSSAQQRSNAATTMPSFLAQVLDDQIPPPYPYVDSILNHNWPSTWNLVLVNLHLPPPPPPNKSSLQQLHHMEQPPDIVTTFFCDILEAETTCQFHQVPPAKRTSPSAALVYNRLNEKAHEWGWWNSTVISPGRSQPRGRFAIMTRTRRQLEQIWKHSTVEEDLWRHKDRYLDCPDPKLLDRLLNRSLTLERQLLRPATRTTATATRRMIRYLPVPSTQMDGNDADHRDRFWRNTTQQRFCSVDAAKFLKQSPYDWKSYYQSLSQ